MLSETVCQMTQINPRISVIATVNPFPITDKSAPFSSLSLSRSVSPHVTTVESFSLLDNIGRWSAMSNRVWDTTKFSC